jgi:hypothetical protein
MSTDFWRSLSGDTAVTEPGAADFNLSITAPSEFEPARPATSVKPANPQGAPVAVAPGTLESVDVVHGRLARGIEIAGYTA